MSDGIQYSVLPANRDDQYNISATMFLNFIKELSLFSVASL